MNTEKLEKLKKSLDNKFIPDSMKDKIRTEIQKLESEIKEKEITPTEIKEEVKNIEEKVEEAIEVAEKKEEKQEKTAKKTTPKATSKEAPKATTGTKKTAMALAKEIRKEGESWTDAVKRAGKEMKGIKEDVKKETKSEIAKLKSLIRKRKDLKGVSNSNLMRDGQRKAMPMGKRVSATGNTYYENRRNRTDKGKVGELYLAKGGNVDYKHNYMMLSRLQMDCEYYLNYGNRNEKVLWAGNVDEQIEEMKRLWNSFPKDKKPEWLTMNQILDYEKQMKNSYADGGAIPNNYEGKTPEQVWNMFTTSQKYHFLLDHNKEIESTPRSIEDNTKKSYKFLPTKVKVSFKKHIETGEYANGGRLDGYLIVERFDHYNNNPLYQVVDKSDKTDYVGEYHTTRKDAEEELKKLSNSYADGGFMDGVYAKGGLLTPSQRYVQEIKGLTGLTQKSIEDYIYQNKLSNEEVLNIVIGLGRKQIDNKDVTTAMIGKKNNAESNKLLDFAKSKKAMSYSNGGMMNNMSVHDGTDFMNTPVYYRGGAMAFADGGDFMSGAYANKGAEIFRKPYEGQSVILTNTKNPIRHTFINKEIVLENKNSNGSFSGFVRKTGDKVPFDLYPEDFEQYENGGFMDGVYERGGGVDFYEQLAVYVQGVGSLYKGTSMKKAISIANSYNKKHPNAEIVIIDEKYGDEYDLNGINKDDYENGGFMDGVYAGGGSVDEVYDVDINYKQIKGYLGRFPMTEKTMEKLSEAFYFMYFDLYDTTDKKPMTYIQVSKIITDSMKEKGLFEDGGFMNGVYAEDGAMVNKDGIRVKSVAMPKKELTEAEWLAKNNESREARAYAVGGGIFADTFTGETGTHYTGLTGETNAMSSGEMFADGGDVGDLFQNYDEQPEELAEIVNFYMEKFDEGDYDYEDSQNFLKEVEAIGYTFDYGLDNEPYGLRPIGTELNEYSNGGAIANQQLIADAHLRPAEMFGREGIPAYNRGGALKNERKYVNHSQDYEVSYARKHPSRHGYGNIKYDGGGEFSQFGKFISSQIEYIISLKTIASKKEPIQNLLKNMDDYRGGTEIEKRLTTDNLKYALQQKTVSKINEVLKISLNALKD